VSKTRTIYVADSIQRRNNKSYEYLFELTLPSLVPNLGPRSEKPPTEHIQKPCIEERMIMNFKPLQDRILVKRVAQQSTTLSGIIIPESAKEKPITGLVLAVGAGKTDDAGNVRPLDVAEGDTVLFGKYAGTEIKIEGLEHTILREDDVLGIVES